MTEIIKPTKIIELTDEKIPNMEEYEANVKALMLLIRTSIAKTEIQQKSLQQLFFTCEHILVYPNRKMFVEVLKQIGKVLKDPQMPEKKKIGF